MPSFDVVSELNHHELNNAIDQANREAQSRYDFKGADPSFTLKETTITLEAETEFQVSQMLDLLFQKASKRGLELGYFSAGAAEVRGKRTYLQVGIKEGIDKELAKEIVKQIKESKLKVQAAIQGDQVRVTGKNKDDLQSTIALLKKTQTKQPLQFINFRD